MPISNLVAFWAVSIIFVITPGADWAFAISGGINRAVTPAIGGLLIGHLVAVLVVAAGVGGVVASLPAAMLTLMVLGAAYLLVLGIGMLRASPGGIGAGAALGRSRLGWIQEGACVSGLNPKVFLLFLALLPQFTAPGAVLSVPLQLLALGMVHLANCALVYVAVGLGARVLLVARPAASLAITRLSGAAMVVISVCLLTSQVMQFGAHRGAMA